MSDHTLDALNASWADTGRHLEEKEWNKKHKRDEEQVEKKQKTEDSSSSEEEEEDDDFILLVNLIPLPHECPAHPHECDDEEDGPCCHTETNTCECDDIDHGFEWYTVYLSNIGKAGGPFESCQSDKDVLQLFRTKGVSHFQDYLVSTQPEIIVWPSKGCHIMFI